MGLMKIGSFGSPQYGFELINHYMANGTQGEQEWFTGASSSGTAALDTAAGEAGKYGVLLFNTSTGATAKCYSSSNNPGQILVGAGGMGITVEQHFKINDLSSATEQYVVRMGMHDGLTGSTVTDGIYIEYASSDSVNWQYCTAAAGTRSVNASSKVVTTGWHTTTIKINAAGDTISYYVDGELIGSETTNIPTDQLGITAQLIKTAGTTDRQIDLDYQYFRATK